MNEPRMYHRCSYYRTGKIYRTPVPGQSYYRHCFRVECPRCHVNQIIPSPTRSKAEAEYNKYPELPKFPK